MQGGNTEEPFCTLPTVTSASDAHKLSWPCSAWLRCIGQAFMYDTCFQEEKDVLAVPAFAVSSTKEDIAKTSGYRERIIPWRTTEGSGYYKILRRAVKDGRHVSFGKEKVSRFTDSDFKPVNQLLFKERAVNRSRGDELSETRSLSGRSGRGSSHPKKLRTSPLRGMKILMR